MRGAMARCNKHIALGAFACPITVTSPTKLRGRSPKGNVCPARACPCSRAMLSSTTWLIPPPHASIPSCAAAGWYAARSVAEPSSASRRSFLSSAARIAPASHWIWSRVLPCYRHSTRCLPRCCASSRRRRPSPNCCARPASRALRVAAMSPPSSLLLAAFAGGRADAVRLGWPAGRGRSDRGAGAGRTPACRGGADPSSGEGDRRHIGSASRADCNGQSRPAPGCPGRGAPTGAAGRALSSASAAQSARCLDAAVAAGGTGVGAARHRHPGRGGRVLPLPAGRGVRAARSGGARAGGGGCLVEASGTWPFRRHHCRAARSGRAPGACNPRGLLGRGGFAEAACSQWIASGEVREVEAAKRAGAVARQVIARGSPGPRR